MKSKLINIAKKASKHAYIPYSNFPVGAAVLMDSGNIYSGCNIENAAYGLTCCAERVAIFKAIAANESNFVSLAVIGNTEKPISPCGACRQVMVEFFNDNVEIFLSNEHDTVKTTIGELLPYAFKLEYKR